MPKTIKPEDRKLTDRPDHEVEAVDKFLSIMKRWAASALDSELEGLPKQRSKWSAKESAIYGPRVSYWKNVASAISWMIHNNKPE